MVYEKYLNEEDYKILSFLLTPRSTTEIMAKFDKSQGEVWQKTIRMEGQGLIRRVQSKGKAKTYQTIKEPFQEYIEIYNSMYGEQDG